MATNLRQFRYPDIPPDLLNPPANHVEAGGDNDSSDRPDHETPVGRPTKRTHPSAGRLLVVGVLGKSNHPVGNKMSPFDLLQYYPELDPLLAPATWPCTSDITFYMQPAAASRSNESGKRSSSAAILYMHFVTADDAACIENLPDEMLDDPAHNALTLAAWARAQSARHLLLAIQTCHILVITDPAANFDTSQLPALKALRGIRERFVVPQVGRLLQLLPPESGRLMPGTNKDMRLCSPRVLFWFGRAAVPMGHLSAEDVKRLEFEMEDRIYKMLRHEFVITNNAAASLFCVPRNKRFVYMGGEVLEEQQKGREWKTAAAAAEQFDDPLADALDLLDEFVEASSRDRRSAGGLEATSGFDLDDIRPYNGYAKVLPAYAERTTDQLSSVYDILGGAGAEPPRRRCFMDLLGEHIEEALDNGFDDSCSKFKGKSQFVVPEVAQWFRWFRVMHELLVVQTDAEEEQKEDVKSGHVEAMRDEAGGGLAYSEARRRFRHDLAEQLRSQLDTDARFFAECEEHGVTVAVDIYMDMLPKIYSWEYHISKLMLAGEHLHRFARQPGALERMQNRLCADCLAIWHTNRRQCDRFSVRGNPCLKAQHHTTDNSDSVADTEEDHSSNVVYIAACNCGRTQGRRCDPFTVREANHEFYQQLRHKCTGCQTAQHIRLPVFQPSVRDFRAASVGAGGGSKRRTKASEGKPTTSASTTIPATEPELDDASASQGSQSSSLFLAFSGSDEQQANGDDEDDGRLVHRSEGVCNADDANDAQQLIDAMADVRIGSDNNGAQSRDDEDNSSDEEVVNRRRATNASNSDDDSDLIENDDDSDSTNEHLLDCQENDATDTSIDDTTAVETSTTATAAELHRQPSTIEYLPGMLHSASPAGLLPQFASWSLLCIGPSSIYSHSSGLPEHVQAGFLNGSNVLLPWDVHVRLEHAAVWAAAFENRSAHRRRRMNNNNGGSAGGSVQRIDREQQHQQQQGQVITLKVFIGCEYECPLGHRFFMATPERALRNGSAGLAKDSGTRVVFNDMPLYAPCPCRSAEHQAQQQGTDKSASASGTAPKSRGNWTTARVAQLMRVHIVTPKAPVHVIVEPRVRVSTGKVFVMGLAPPARLTQSSYWVLRLPYAYRSDEGGLVRGPQRLQSGESLTQHGCLEAAMFGVSEVGATTEERKVAPQAVGSN